MSARTPGPLAFYRWNRCPETHPNCERPNTEDHVPILYRVYSDDSAEPDVIARFSDLSRKEATWHADNIVEACNAHDSLVSQRDALREAIRVMLAKWDDQDAYLDEAADNLRAALALADGAK